MVFNPTLNDGPIRHQSKLIRATLFDVDISAHAGFPTLLIQSLFAVSVAVAFDVVMLLVVLPLAPFSETVPSTVASRLERAAAIASLTILLLVTTPFVFEFVSLAGDAKKGPECLKSERYYNKIRDKPEEFRPERFLGSPIDVKGHDFELLPFGSGRRMCPGYSLGLKVIQVSLANLLHGFAWRLPDGRKREDLSMEEIFGLSTPRKEPLEAVVEPKLPEHLYDL